MQKLIFRNANGVEVDLTSGDFGITEWKGFSDVSLNLQTQQVPFQDGSVYLDGLLGNREISVTLAVNDNNDLEKRYELRRNLIEILNPKLGEGTLIYKNDYLMRQIKGVPLLPVFKNKNSNDRGTLKASLAWTCPSPYWEDIDEKSAILTTGETLEIINDGDIEINPHILMFGSSSNTAIQNLTNNKKINIIGSLEANYQYDIKTAVGKKGVLKKNLSYKEVFNGYKISSSFYSEKYNLLILGGGFDSIFVSNDGILFNQIYTFLGSFDEIDASNIYTKVIENICYSEELDLFVFGSYGNGQNYTIVSQDLVHFEKRYYNAGTNNRMSVLYYAKEKQIFYASGVAASSFLKSSDGYNWDIVSNNFGQIQGVVEADGFIFASASNGLLKSSDGSNFNVIEAPSSLSGKIIYEKNMLIVYGASIFVSTNLGSTWSEYNHYNDIGNIYRLTYLPNKNKFLISASKGLFLTNNFNDCTLCYEKLLNSICYIPNWGVYKGFDGTAKIFSSKDGESWKLQYKGFYAWGSPYIIDYAYSKKLNTLVLTSEFSYFVGQNISNLENYRVTSYGDGHFQLGCVYCDKSDLFISLWKWGNRGLIKTSADGENWENQNVELGNGKEFIRLRKFGDKLVSIPLNDNHLYVSEDGLNWDSILIDENITGGFQDIAFDGVNYYLYQYGYETSNLYISSNLTSWEKSEITFHGTLGFGYFPFFISVKYIEERNIFISAQSDGLYSSDDGKIFTKIKSSLTESYYGFDYIPELFLYVITGSHGLIEYSCDLTNWTVVEAKVKTRLLSSHYVQGYLTIFGERGVVIQLEYANDENAIQYISSDSDLNFSLEKGLNEIRLSRNAGYAQAKISYRQKYIGV